MATRPAAATAGTWPRDDALVALGLALLALLVAISGWAWRADRLVYDAALAWWRQPPPDDIVIVAIDDASIAAIGRWPWKRSVHATLIEQLAAAGPRALLLDLVLSEPDPDPQQDVLLAAALQRLGRGVMPVAWQAMPGEPLRMLAPVAPLHDVVRLGAAEPAVDADGVLRHAFLSAGPADRPYTHLAAVMLEAGGQAVHPRTALEQLDVTEQPPGWLRQGRFLIRYAAEPGAVPRVSYVDVLRGAVPPERLAGRYLLVGMTAQGMGDTLATPVNAGSHAMPGIEVLAHQMATLRSGQAPRPLGAWAGGLVSAAAVLLLVGSFAAVGTRLALLAALASLPLALLASVLLLRGGWWWEPAPFVLAAALAYPLWSWRRLERGVAVLDREIARLAVEPGLLAPAAAVPGGPVRDRLSARLAALHTAADTLRSARRFLADVLAGLPTAMLVDDGAGRVLLANPLASALFEVESADEMQGLDLARLLGEFDGPPDLDWPAALVAVRRGAPPLVVQVAMAGHGDYLIHAHAVPMHGGMRLIVAVTDIAPIKQAEREREELLAFISHDLRAPATSIALLAELELAGRGALSSQALLRELQRLAQRTLVLADDLVRLAQVAQRPLQLEPVEVAALMNEALADLQPQATAVGVHLRVILPLPLQRAVMDRALVLRALGNLLSNAIKHSPPAGTVHLQAQFGDGHVLRLAVSDQGPGLAPEAAQRLMQARDGLLPAGAQGVGFGLLFVQRVAHRHRGRLLVAAAPDGGARFELVIGDGSGKA